MAAIPDGPVMVLSVSPLETNKGARRQRFLWVRVALALGKMKRFRLFSGNL
jgi:hypothetical protein